MNLGVTTTTQTLAPPVAIRLHNVSKRFGTQTILHATNLELAPGEVVVGLGPSGSGKTTLLRLLAGLEQSDQGELYLRG